MITLDLPTFNELLALFVGGLYGFAIGAYATYRHLRKRIEK